MDKPLEINDFSGGMTDNYIDSSLSKYERADNFNIVVHGQVAKLKQRDGFLLHSNDKVTGSSTARIGFLKYFASTLFAQNATKLYKYSSGWAELAGPTNVLFPSASESNVVYCSTWNNHMIIGNNNYQIPVKIYKDGSAVFQARTCGLPDLASNPTVAIEGGGTAGTTFTYLYKFVHYFTYTVGTVVFEDYGKPTTAVTFQKGAAIGVAPEGAVISAIPVLANGSTTNYGTTVIKIKAYRTVNNGSVFYYVGEVTNGTTSLTERVTDAALVLNTLLYTEDGSLENGSPPLCNVFHMVDNTGFYGDIKSGTQLRTNRYYQSIPGDFDAVPTLNFKDVDDDIKGISSYKSIPILFCNKFVYRIEGYIDQFGRGYSIPIKISDSAGCLSHESIIQTLEGVFWAGTDGFYFTDGYKCVKVSSDIDSTYDGMVNSTNATIDSNKKKRIQGRYDATEKRLLWTMQEEDGVNGNNDKIFVGHILFSASGDLPITTWSNSSFFNPTCITFVGNILYSANKGYVLYQNENPRTDPKVDTSVAATAWTTRWIPFTYEGFSTSFGDNFTRKFCTRIVLTCKQVTSVSLLITSNSDDDSKVEELKPIRSRGGTVWGDPDMYWGDPDVVWGASGLIQEQRRFPAASLKCSYKQIKLTNASVFIVGSTLLGTANVDGAAKTAIISSGLFPSDPVDWYISFANDSYVKQYLITSRTSDMQVVFSDTTDAVATSSALNFKITGIPKNEKIHLLGYSLHWLPYGRSQSGYTAEDTGTGST